VANTLTIKAGVKFTPDNAKQLAVDTGTFSLEVTNTGGDVGAGVTQVIATSDTLLAIPASIATPGYILIKNIDATNYVELNTVAAPANYTIKLEAGEFALFRMAHTAINAKANTASVTVQFWVFEA